MFGFFRESATDFVRQTQSNRRNIAQLVALVNRLNAEWVLAARRMSPRLLMDFLAFTGPEVEACFASLDPMKMGGPVSWAGPEPAPQWFDVAREFTERWHHQQQIRDATDRPPLYDPYFLSPVLDTFVRALPHNFRDPSRQREAPSNLRFPVTRAACGSFQGRTRMDACSQFIHSAGGGSDSSAGHRLAVVHQRNRSPGGPRAGRDSRDAGLVLPIFATTAIIG